MTDEAMALPLGPALGLGTMSLDFDSGLWTLTQDSGSGLRTLDLASGLWIWPPASEI